MLIKRSLNRNRLKSYNHPNIQKGWRDSSPRVGYSQNQLRDEDYHKTLAFHNPLWRYIIKHYPKEAQTPIAILGYSAIPIAIELSQWTYPIIYITDTYEGVKKAKRDCEIQAGFFKHFLYFNYQYNCPRVRITTFLEALVGWSKLEIYQFLDLLLRRCNEIVCAVPDDRNWSKILEGRYDYNMYKYPKNNYYLLTIKENG